LNRFDFIIEYKKGKENRADALSRRPDYEVLFEEQFETLLPSHMFRAMYTEATIEGTEFRDSLKHTNIPPELRKEFEDVTKGWTFSQGIIMMKEGQLYIPNNKDLRRRLIRAHHDPSYMGHPGVKGTIDHLRRNYVWKGLNKDVYEYVVTCLKCQQTKTYPQKPFGLLQPSEPVYTPWTNISVNFIMPLPASQGYNALMVVVCQAIKQARLIPCTTDISAEGTARLYKREIWKHHGWPHKITSDRGEQFALGFMKELNRLLKSKRRFLQRTTHERTGRRNESTASSKPTCVFT
jgi:Integrase zinc binding domain